MKKYRVIKDFYWLIDWKLIKKWEETEWSNILLDVYLIDEWFIEEKKEKIKSKYKVWDYVVCEDEDWDKFIKICEIRKEQDWTVEYNAWYTEDELRLPTQKEFDLYFR